MSSSTPVGGSKDTVFAVPRRKTDMAAPTTIPSKEPKSASMKQHKRSRSGCFTCRLRRKKCDEVKPACRACKHLGLRCDYKRPTWWGNSDQRREQKDFIKNVIKRTQLVKKSSTSMNQPPSIGSTTPPGLCHSISTPEGFSDSYLGSYTHSRAASIDQSPLTSDPGLSNFSPESYFGMPPHHHMIPPPPHYSMFSPYEIDIKTERQIFVNDVPTRRDSTISSISAFQPQSLHSTDHSPALGESWVQQDYFESSRESLVDEALDFDFFDLPHDQMTPTHEAIIEVDECDRPLLDHFLNKVSKLLFPVLDATQHGTAHKNVILPALEANKCYLHCCLSVSGMHMKAVERLSSDDVDNDIMRHRYSTISELCAALDRDEDHEQILEATLAMIFFPSSVVRPDDVLPDVPWHQHLQAAKSLVDKLQLPDLLLNSANSAAHPPFNMTLTAWIDILGATMQGKSPVFAHAYRELNIAGRTAGLAELMGCDDQLMFLISEIACLEERKLEGFDEVMLCKYIEILGTQISMGETSPSSAITTPSAGGPGAGSNSSGLVSAVSATGALRPKQLQTNISAVFRLAARIYLCSMVPGFDVNTPSTLGLVEAFVDAMAYIPAGPDGFDRSLSWPLLIAGAVSTPDSSFRPMFAERGALLEDMADIGSFGRVGQVLAGLWTVNDFAAESGLPRLHWRDVMVQKGWDCLLI